MYSKVMYAVAYFYSVSVPNMHTVMYDKDGGELGPKKIGKFK